jgi:hypothetical protein
MRSPLKIVAVAALPLVVLAGCGGGDGLPNDGIISFTSLSYSVTENGDALNVITVQVLGGTVPIGVTVVTEAGTATDGSDYAGGAIVLAWGEGERDPKTITIPIMQDHEDEPDETITLRLIQPTGGATIRDPLGDTTLNVVDDDVGGALQFSQPGYVFFEDGMPFGGEVMVTRTGGMDGVVSVTVIMTDGTATGDPLSPVEPFDFTPATVTVTFTDQDTTPILVPFAGVIRQDLLPEPGEFFEVELVNPTGGAVVGPAGVAMVTIADDDDLLVIPNPDAGASFGAAVAKVGARLVIGAPGNASGAGLAYVFDPADGSLVDTISRPSSTQLGSMLAQGAATLAIGSPGTVWALDPATRLDRFVLTSALGGFGSSAIVTEDGRLVVGAPQASQALVYDELTGAPQPAITGAGGSLLGASFAPFGQDIAIGAPGTPGHVAEYGGNPFALTVTIDDPAPQTPVAGFGAAVATSALESLVFVGAPDADVGGLVDAGRVDLFSLSPVVTASPAPAGARFGATLAISGDFVWIQAANDGPMPGAGRVWVYDKTLSEIFPVDSPSPAPGGGFGDAMCDFDGSIVLAAPGEGGGVVYIRKLF